MDETWLVQGEKQAVAGRAGPPAGAPDALQEGRDGARRVDLDDPIEVADIDAEFQSARRDDDAVPLDGEGFLCPPALVGRQGGVGQERGDSTGTQLLAERFDKRARVTEDQTLLTAMQPGDDGRRILSGSGAPRSTVGSSRPGPHYWASPCPSLSQACSASPRW